MTRVFRPLTRTFRRERVHHVVDGLAIGDVMTKGCCNTTATPTRPRKVDPCPSLHGRVSPRAGATARSPLGPQRGPAADIGLRRRAERAGRVRGAARGDPPAADPGSDRPARCRVAAMSGDRAALSRRQFVQGAGCGGGCHDVRRQRARRRRCCGAGDAAVVHREAGGRPLRPRGLAGRRPHPPRRRLSPVTLAEAILDRIAAVEPTDRDVRQPLSRRRGDGAGRARPSP